jgi:hypothetical protein
MVHTKDALPYRLTLFVCKEARIRANQKQRKDIRTLCVESCQSDARGQGYRGI